ncbi:MAG: MBL fold metallo-hydrolase [Chloroflexota bacterium]
MYSEYFDIQPLAEGVYAAIGQDSPAAASNAGIIDLGDQVLVFDTFTTSRAGHALRQAAEALTGKPVRCVLLSHFHYDHWCGNQAFEARTVLLSTHETRRLMGPLAEQILEQKKNPSPFRKRIAAEEQRLAQESDPCWQATLQASLARSRLALQDLADLQPRLPEHTFDGRLGFYGTRGYAELVDCGLGHTRSDACLVLPKARLAFIGDLGSFAQQPSMHYGDAPAWKAHLQNLEASELEIFVPGHGPVGGKADLRRLREYMDTLESLVRQVVQSGGSLENAVKISLPTPFDAWLLGGMHRFEKNVKYFYNRLSKAN